MQESAIEAYKRSKFADSERNASKARYAYVQQQLTQEPVGALQQQLQLYDVHVKLVHSRFGQD